MNSSLRGMLLLLFATAMWGLGFIGTRWTFELYSPYWSNALRFLFAGILSIPFLVYMKTWKQKKQLWIDSFSLSLLLFTGQLLQTYGIKLTTIAKSSFITTLYVIFTPIVTKYLFSEKQHYSYWLLVLLALMGMALLCNLNIQNINLGDVLTLFCSLFYALHIIFTGVFVSRGHNPFELNFLQCLFVGILSCLIGLFMDNKPEITKLLIMPDNFIGSAIAGFIIVSIFSSLIAFGIQALAQKTIAASTASLIFLLESPFATLFAYCLLDESMTRLEIMGALLILIAIGLLPVSLERSQKLAAN